MTAVPFDTQTVSYFEDRADGGFAWFVKYDLSFLNGVVSADIRVKLTGVIVTPQLKAAWEKGIESIWNKKVFFDDGTYLYPVQLDVSFVDSGEQYDVTFHPGSGRGDMLNWYSSYQDVTRAHEVGHMIGNFDEYAGGATFGGFVTTHTFMSDLTVAGFEDYFSSIEFYTEQFGAGGADVLSTVLAILGNEHANVLAGTTGRDGFYGLGGRDTISGRGGNDYIDGGAGKDFLTGRAGKDFLIGGSGKDSLTGGGGRDVFLFDSPPGRSNLDHITDFRHNKDKFQFDASVFTALDVGALGEGAFFDGRRATTDAQLIGYDEMSGIVRYDKDGVGGHRAVKVVILDNSPNNVDFHDFVVVT